MLKISEIKIFIYKNCIELCIIKNIRSHKNQIKLNVYNYKKISNLIEKKIIKKILQQTISIKDRNDNKNKKYKFVNKKERRNLEKKGKKNNELLLYVMRR